MDNRVFDINGKNEAQLEAALRCFLTTEYGYIQSVAGWRFHKDKGLILYSYIKEGITPFCDRMGKPKSLNLIELKEILWEWLSSDEAKEVYLEEMEQDISIDDNDISTELGWRLYTETWGQISLDSITSESGSIGAIKRTYLWYGK